jgi:hypothetical protein
MRYTGLFEDFDNIRETQTYVVCKIIDEAQNYIEHLEAKEDTLESVVAYLNELDASPKSETKAEILARLVTLLPGD